MDERAATVLVVDDERHTARLLEYVLRREGYRVVVAHDGESALAEADREGPDAVLLDLELPRLSGTEVLRRFREQSRYDRMVVIVLTARTYDEVSEGGWMEGAQAQCSKPIAPSSLLKTLSDLKVPPRLKAEREGEGLGP